MSDDEKWWLGGVWCGRLRHLKDEAFTIRVTGALEHTHTGASEHNHRHEWCTIRHRSTNIRPFAQSR